MKDHNSEAATNDTRIGGMILFTLWSFILKAMCRFKHKF